ncbi:MAG: hypothetical protein WC931_04230 [Bacilli bacterium]|jgi:hypothetical protein
MREYGSVKRADAASGKAATNCCLPAATAIGTEMLIAFSVTSSVVGVARDLAAQSDFHRAVRFGGDGIARIAGASPHPLLARDRRFPERDNGRLACCAPIAPGTRPLPMTESQDTKNNKLAIHVVGVLDRSRV